MDIIPALDIKDGRCVRLLQGDPRRMIVYADDPLDAARRWIGEGARRLHVVDLDGAFAGHPVHLPMMKAIARLGVPIQVGGGFRTIADLEAALAIGAERVVLGSAAQVLAAEAAGRFGARVVASIDARNGQAAVAGWTMSSGADPIRLAVVLQASGIGRFVYTDIARDGMLGGPALETLRAFVAAVNAPVVAAGGVRSAADVEALEATGVEGVIIGRAIYEGLVNLPAMLARWEGTRC